MSAPTTLGPDLPTLPGLRLIRELGRGGMGVVFAAERLEDATPVAVKVLRDEYAEPHVRRRLRDEARRAGRIDHPGVVKVLDVGEQQHLTWLVMELVDGPSLQDVLDRHGRLPPALAAELIARAADALGAIHAAGLAHGDLKPANLLLPGWPEGGSTFDLSGPVKLVDFGLSRPLPDRDIGLSLGSDWAHSGSTAVEHSPGGTVAFMAPEQWRGTPSTTSSDVYAMGGTLYAALTGAPPYAAPSLPELAYAVAAVPPPVPGHSARDVPPALDTVVTRALAKDPPQRYPDATALASAIRSAVRVQPAPSTRVQPAPSSQGPAATQRTQRMRRLLRTGGRLLSPAVLLLALLFFGSGFLTVSCAPGGYGRATAGGTTTYTGGDLATGGAPQVDKPRRAEPGHPDRLGAQPLIAIAGLLLLAGVVAAVAWPRRRARHRDLAALAAAALVCLVIGETLARSAVIDRLAGQLSYPLPPGRKVSDYVHVADGFWVSLGLTLITLVAHSIGAVRTRRRRR